MRPAPRARLEIRLLGTFEANLDGVSLAPFRSAKVRALLAYLAVEAGRPHRRVALATLLWGEYAEHDANHSLRQALANLRSLLAPLSSSTLTITGQEVELHLEPGQVWVDLHAFDASLVAADPRHASALQRPDPAGLLAQAMMLYRGPFLAGLTLPDSPEFEEWRLLHQEQRHHAALLALERLVSHHLAQGQTGDAAHYARQQLTLEPWSEGAHQSLMLALALEGQRGAALRQYEACRQVLAQELGTVPCAETEALAQQIREGALHWTRGQTEEDHLAQRLPPLPFVARERELARLDGFLGQVLAGQGRVVFVVGEAGSGKTALLARFARRAVEYHRQLVVAGGRCSAYAGGGDPFLPFRQILQALCGEAQAGWMDQDGNPDHTRRLWALYPQAAEAFVQVGPDLIGRFVSGEALEARAGALASSDAPWRARLADLRARSQAGQASPLRSVALFHQVTCVLHALARQQPLVLLLDDLQWIDRASLSLLFHLARQLGDSRVLIAGAYRPSEVGTEPKAERRKAASKRLASLVHECVRQWGDITIELDQADGRHFVDALLDSEPNALGDPFRETLTQHTGGHALFTIELLRAFQERGELVRDASGRWVQASAFRWESLPPRVEAVIAERLGRLPTEWRRALEIASVEGDSFSAEVVARALGAEPAWIVEGLSGFLSSDSRLVQALGVHPLAERGQPVSRYRFGHVLFRDYLYTHLDAVRRAHLHGAVGEALESLCGGEEAALAAASVPLAHHYEQAGQPGRAVAYLRRAGRQAILLGAYEEAIALFRQGLALLEPLPEGPERGQLERQILLDLFPPLMPAQGWASAERDQLAQKALDLARQQPASEADLIGALFMRAEILSSQGKHPEGLELAELLLHLAQRSQHPAYLALAHYQRGQNRFFSGDIAASIPDFRQALALYDDPQHAPLLPWTDGDLRVRCLGLLALALGYVGYADQGRSCSQQALAQARELGQPLTEAVALTFAGCGFSALCLGAPSAGAYARHLIELSVQMRLPAFHPYGLIYDGWARALDGAGRPAIVQMRTGLAEWQAMGHRAGNPFLLALLAQALQRDGAWDEALSTVEQGLALAMEIGAPHRADLYRLKGELLKEHEPLTAGQAEACLHTALTEARQQGSKLLELRAAVSLARLWQAQGRRAEAGGLLAGIYGWFTEGFDTPDLVEAKVLLDALRDPSEE
jgi:DNA-binding SARP family transcriptional activator/tetratricopeptide (TPR) repeat protein